MSIARDQLKQQRHGRIVTGNRLDPVHPGSILLYDFIEPMGLTRYRVAKALHVPQRRIDEICRGERAITADTAVRLGAAFGVDAQFWLNLQSQYDIELVHLAPSPQTIERLVAA